MPFNTIEKYKIWKEKNKDKILFQRKQYRLKNKKRLCEESKKYYYDNYEKVMKRYEKYREDPEIFKYKKSLKMKSNLKLNYKITIEEYNNKLKKQKNRCAICNKHRNKFKRNLAVDHCHTTGKIRDLLCSICNTRLGYYEKSDIDKLKKYINKHRKDVN
jgi:hypothetical protein